MIIYRGSYTDIETNPLTNENAQVVKRLDLIDMSSNPFNVVLTEEVSGTDTIYTFSFDTLPVTAIGTAIEYTSNGGLNWFLVPGGTTSPQSITLPTLDYEFSFTIQIPGGWLYWSNINQIVPLEFTDNPVNDVVIDNDENVFTPIRSRQLEIEIYSSNDINIRNFVDGGDDRFKANWYINDVLNFTGHLSVADISQEFLPDPNVISLTAVDGLGLLSDIPLTDRNGEVPTNEIEILDLLQFALSKTSLQLNLKVIFNIREETASNLDDDITGAGHFFRYCFLDAKTFEDEIGTCENCYDVISKILGHEAVLFQHLGEWVILRIDEVDYDLPLNTYYKWDWFGDFIEKGTESNQKNIGVGEDYSFMNDSAVVYIAQLFRESKLNYKYETPKEVPCNSDFERGEFIEDFGTVTIDDEVLNAKKYEFDCWDLGIHKRNGFPKVAANGSGYLIKLFNGIDYESERYVEIDMGTGTHDPAYFKSEFIPISFKDRFLISLSYKWDIDFGAELVNTLSVELVANDGTYWYLLETGQWFEYPAGTGLLIDVNNAVPPVDFDTTDYQSISVESESVPKSGRIYIYIKQAFFTGVSFVRYNRLSFEYYPYINGSNQKYTGQQTIVNQSVGNRNTREEDVFISDSPSPNFKGAIKIITGYTEIYTGAAIFYSGNGFQIAGNQTNIFKKNQKIVISDTSSNNITTTITSAVYLIIPDLTQITVSGITVSETDSDVTISLTVFGLAGLFYDAARNPSGTTEFKKYAEIQAYDVWNQVNRTMVRFEADIDHSNPAPALIKKYYITDANVNSNNRIFLLLHYDYNSYLCEWNAFLTEVVNSNEPKEYTGLTFKYITK